MASTGSSSRELATVATAPILGQLSSIEILARHRELCGYELLDELERVLRICGEKPGACHVVLNGPDTLLISRFEPAVDFLIREVGFVLLREVIAPDGTVLSEADVALFDAGIEPQAPVAEDRTPPQPSGASSRSRHRRTGSGGTSVVTASKRPREYISLVMPTPPGAQRNGRRGPSISDTSPDWKLFQRKIAEGLRLVEWARWANTSLLSIKLTEVVWHNKPPSAPYGFEVRVAWQSVLGKEAGELFSIGDRKYRGAQPNVTELCDTKCDRPCVIRIYVYRDWLLGARKLAGRAVLHYDNEGVVDTRVDILAPDTDPDSHAPDSAATTPTAGGGKAGGDGGAKSDSVRGSVRVEVASIRHRYTRLQEELIREAGLKKQAESRVRLAAEARARLEEAEERKALEADARRLRAAAPRSPVTVHRAGSTAAAAPTSPPVQSATVTSPARSDASAAPATPSTPGSVATPIERADSVDSFDRSRSPLATTARTSDAKQEHSGGTNGAADAHAPPPETKSSGPTATAAVAPSTAAEAREQSDSGEAAFVASGEGVDVAVRIGVSAAAVGATATNRRRRRRGADEAAASDGSGADA